MDTKYTYVDFVTSFEIKMYILTRIKAANLKCRSKTQIQEILISSDSTVSKIMSERCDCCFRV